MELLEEILSKENLNEAYKRVEFIYIQKRSNDMTQQNQVSPTPEPKTFTTIDGNTLMRFGGSSFKTFYQLRFGIECGTMYSVKGVKICLLWKK